MHYAITSQVTSEHVISAHSVVSGAQQYQARVGVRLDDGGEPREQRLGVGHVTGVW